MIRRSKLKLPPLTRDFVHRPRLGARLSASSSASAIVVEAPAGYGKRTLIRHWLETSDEPRAWLSLDRHDTELRSFVDYFVHALRTAVPGVCANTGELLADDEVVSDAEIMNGLVHELELIEQRIVLVVEGLSPRADPEIYSLLDRILEHPLDSLCLIFSTRGSLPLSLSRLRTQARLTELGLTDLAFNREETEVLVQKIAGIVPSRRALDNLENRVEGWAAGLRFIAAGSPGESDLGEHLERFEATPRVIELYLEDEVLRYEHPCVRRKLYRASILDRFSLPLWQFLFESGDPEAGDRREVGRPAAADWVRTELEAGSFMLPVAGREGWYRFHPIFRRLLQQHLEQEVAPEEVGALHQRASEWFESEGLIAEAIAHALSAGNETRAAEMVEQRKGMLLDAGDVRELGLWLERLPLELRHSRHPLLMAEAAIAYRRYELWKLRPLLVAAEKLGGDADDSVERTFFNAVLDMFGDNLRASADRFREVLEYGGDEYGWLQLDSYFYRGMSLQIEGRGDEARDHIERALSNERNRNGSTWVRLYATSIFLRMVRGELVLNDPTTKNLLLDSNPVIAEWARYALGISALRRFELEQATDHLAHVSIEVLRVDARAGIAIALALQGRDDEARECLTQAWRVASERGTTEQIGSLASCEARIALLRGDLERARSWQQSYRRSAEVWSSRISVEVSDISEVRVLAASDDASKLEEARARIEELWSEFQALHLECQKREIAPLRALLLERCGEHEAAVAAIREAVESSAGEGWIRSFVELGPAIVDLLGEIPSSHPERAFIDQLQTIVREKRTTAGPALRVVRHGLPDVDLTNREVDVLELLAARLRDKEIAERLGISQQTVKTHLRNLYRKLDCSNRREAVSAARRLAILPSDLPHNPPPPLF